MKKLIACVCCVALSATVLFAQTDEEKANHAVQKASRQAFLKQLKIYVQIKHILTPVESGLWDGGQDEIHTTCSAVVLDGNGNIAIKSDCYPAIRKAAQYKCVNMTVFLKRFGSYKNTHPEMYDNPFYFETERASLRGTDSCDEANEFFEIKRNSDNKIKFLTYHIDFPENSELEGSLQEVFAKQKPVTADEAAALLKDMAKPQEVSVGRI